MRDSWERLARDAIEEFEDTRQYAGDYFTEKWGYDETSRDFMLRAAALERNSNWERGARTEEGE